jgi:hypothetical protein
MDQKRLNVRVTKAEAALLALYAKRTYQTQSRVVRVLIRSLKAQLPKVARDAR